MKTIKTYIYNEDSSTQLIDEDIELSEAISKLKSGEIHFFSIIEGDSFIEITLSDKDELITNGYE